MTLKEDVARVSSRSLDNIDTIPFEKVILWGISERTHRMLENCIEAEKVSFIIDRDPWKQGRQYHSIPIVHPSEAAQKCSLPIIIGTQEYSAIFDILYQAHEYGLTNIYYSLDPVHPRHQHDFFSTPHQAESVERIYTTLHDKDSKQAFAHSISGYANAQPVSGFTKNYPQFNHPVVRIEDGDTVLFAGAYTGGIPKKMCEITTKSTIYAFEPSMEIVSPAFSKLKPFIKTGRIQLINKGLWKKDDRLSFYCDTPMDGNSGISETGVIQVEVTSIDTFVRANNIMKVDMISLDIEGAESECLEGAVETILRDKPKLQLSTYHKTEHVYELFNQVQRIRPDYTWYFGHHSLSFLESMLYAI